MSENRSDDELIISGYVRWFDTKNEYGFIQDDETDQDILIHGNVLTDFGIAYITAGTFVKVAAERNALGLRATRIVDLRVPENEPTDKTDDLQSQDQLTMVPARLRWIDVEKGFGFANRFNDIEDVLIGISVLKNAGLLEIQAGQAFGMSVIRTEKGLSAVGAKPWLQDHK